MNQALILNLDNEPVRFTPNGKVSVLDAIRAVINSDHPLSVWENLKKEHPEQTLVDDDLCFTGFDAYEKVIESGIDVAVIACTSHFHSRFLKAAVDAGCAASRA